MLMMRDEEIFHQLILSKNLRADDEIRIHLSDLFCSIYDHFNKIRFFSLRILLVEKNLL